ncbi:MAG TPA: hypothetical protein VM937_06765 [Burkholderiaceae bacterium]|jgi:outer membrane lipoprotein SlyB|nr:hypothetical protein [Burkholderiaceae bacterium]
MKNARFIVVIAALAITGCATSFAPGDNFNDWTNSASYHHYQQPRAVAVTPSDDNGTAGE